jgi:hypothetical protein
MTIKNNRGRRLVLIAAAAFLLVASPADTQPLPNLFRQRPATTMPGSHGKAAHAAPIDAAILSSNPAGLTIPLPGQPDLIVERRSHQLRSARSRVWRGRGQTDGSVVTLTEHEGLLFGHIQSGNEVFAIRPGTNGRTIIEKLDPDSFPPEWGHDAVTFGYEKIPPLGTSTLQEDTTASAQSAAPDGTIPIVLLSVYTPQARAAAGGTTQIQGQIQAAVDQANTAFINSNMAARFVLAQTAEVSYNDSGNIDTDLDWVTSNASVASLRNTHAADLVSLIVNNGGNYCGIGWVQRNPGAGFANYAFQVTARGCLPNHTLAHEHGHNMGMEHDPASAGISGSGASYPWSFGHYVNGSFRTIMSYNVCSLSCPRVLHFSNPDVSYNGFLTGIADQRDNAHTGDLTAAIVANFRSGGGSATNSPPTFTSDPIVKPDATQGLAYTATVASDASDSDGDPLTFAKTAGPAWLSLAADGSLFGTPGAGDSGTNWFTISTSDGRGGSDTATMQINVTAGLLAPPSDLSATPGATKRIELHWKDNSSSETGFRIERSTNNAKFSKIATVGAGVNSFVNSGLKRGKTYYYRVRANGTSSNSDYSNVASAVAP